MAEADAGFDVRASAVRATVRQHVAHALERFSIDGAVPGRVGDSADAAHQQGRPESMTLAVVIGACVPVVGGEKEARNRINVKAR